MFAFYRIKRLREDGAARHFRETNRTSPDVFELRNVRGPAAGFSKGERGGAILPTVARADLDSTGWRASSG